MSQKFTNELRTENAFGAQFQTIIYAVLMTEIYYNGEYVYTTPLLEEIYGEEESRKLEEVMTIKNNFKCIKEIKNENITTIDFAESRKFVENNLDMCLSSKSMENIKNIFKQNKDLDIFDKNYTNITIHIRRPSIHNNIDIPEHFCGITEYKLEDKNKINIEYNERISKDDYFLKVINKIRDENKDKKLKFHICSEGYSKQFENFINEDTILHLNASLVFTYNLMITADILVISKSSFSYPAALLSDGQIYYPSSFWCNPSNKWIIMQCD